jgi:hypothetical protein
MVGGYKAVKKMGGIPKILSTYYPNVDWKSNLSVTNQKAGQRWLKEIVCEIFPGYSK